MLELRRRFSEPRRLAGEGWKPALTTGYRIGFARRLEAHPSPLAPRWQDCRSPERLGDLPCAGELEPYTSLVGEGGGVFAAR